MVILATFSLLGKSGSKSRKQSMNRFRGRSGYRVLKGVGVGDMIQNQTSPVSRFPEVGISDWMS